MAHASQLVPVPESLGDEEAVLTDPLACSLHAVLRADLSGAQAVLVYGTGTLGLGVIACLRATGFAGRIDAVARASWLKEWAVGLGANGFLVLPPAGRERFGVIAGRTGATVHRARFGNYTLSGGYDVIFECVGSAATISESLRWVRARGQVVMVGTGHGRGADLTPVWFRELTVLGAYGRQVERFGDRRIGSYQLVHELMTSGRLPVRSLLTHTFRVQEFRRALQVAAFKSRRRAVKVAIDFR